MVDDVERYEALRMAFTACGWALDKPVLAGYRALCGRVQLVSGSHRWAAARDAGILVPVWLKTREEVESFWGSDAWLEWVKGTPNGPA